MLFWIFVILFVIFGLLSFVAFDRDHEFLFGSSLAISVLSMIVAFFMLLVVVGNNVGVDSHVGVLNARYESLVYQYENDFYDNDNDVGKRELIEDIRRWNEDLEWHKAAQRDFWLGIFHADIYDQFELISLNK